MDAVTGQSANNCDHIIGYEYPLGSGNRLVRESQPHGFIDELFRFCPLCGAKLR